MINIRKPKDVQVRCELGWYDTAIPYSLPVREFTGCLHKCPPGYYGNTSFLTSSSCSGVCPAGRYCPEATGQPNECPAGTHLEPPPAFGTSIYSCIPCFPGTYNAEAGLSAASCRSCPAGKYTEKLRQTECTACPPGGYCSATNAASLRQTYTPCPSGTFNTIMGAASSAACVSCPAGTASPTFGQTDPSTCMICPAGSIAPEPGSAACQGCPPGSFQNQPGMTHCEMCPTGAYCPEGASAALPCHEGTYSGATNLTSADECTPSDPGFYATTGSIKQTPCAAGAFGATFGLSECTFCPAGKYQDDKQATACKPCKSGHYCEHGAAAALPCPPGTWSDGTDNINASECSMATSGHFAATGSDKQTACREDTYNPLAGQSNEAACIPCPPHSITNGMTGAMSIGSCVCESEFYNNATSDGQANCILCPSGTDCFQPGFSILTLPVKCGYYRLHELSYDVRRCLDAATNCSDSPECIESTSGCRGTVNESLALTGRRLGEEMASNGSLGCHDGLTGAFCLLCAPHPEGKRIYYSRASRSHVAQCRECRDSARNTILLFFAFVALAALVVLQAWTWYVACSSDRLKKQLQCAWRAFTPHVKLKVLIGVCSLLYPSHLH